MPNESSPSPIHRTAQSLLASALDDESASILLSALGVSPSSLSSPLSSPLSPTSPSLPTAFSEDRVQALASSLSNLKRREVEKQVVPLLLARYRFVRVASPSSAPSSSLSQSQTLYALPPHALAYERVNLLNLSQELLTEANTWLDASEQAKIIDTLFSMAPAFTVIPKRFYAISTQLYWDTHTHKLVPTVPTSEHCFIRLFDTPNPTKQTPSIPLTSLDESFSALVQREYQETLALLSSSTHPITSLSDIAHTLPRSFRFIEEWADDDPGLYWDIMTLISTVFMEHKPLGAYFLIGLSRNGKSSEICHNMLVLAKRNRGEPADRCSNNNTYDTSSQWQFIKHGDLRPGDYVMSWEGTPTKVTHIWPQDSKPCYRLTLQDGRTVEASNTHQWAVVPTHRLAGHRPRVRDEHGRATHKRRTVPIERYDPDMWEIKTTEEMARDFVDSRGRPKWHIPPAHPVCLPERTLPIDPHTLGVILGDAYIYPSGKVRISGQDPDLIEEVTGRPALINQKKTAKSPNHITNYDGTTSRFKEPLVKWGLAGTHSYDKFIPEEYLMGHIGQRYALLRGLMDTDGDISHGKVNSKNNQTTFSTSSKRLADQVRSLVFSLGGTATVREKMGRYKLSDGTYKETRPTYRLFIRTLENPFTLPRKAQYWHPQKRLGYTAITKIEYIGEEPCQCITIDAPSHLYQVTPYFVPTHNCANLLHTIFGTQNTSRVRLSQLGDPHHASALATSILNAPDDEDDDITQYQGAFKELASHSVFHATKLYSATPLEVDGSHLTFVFPVNTLPMWKGTSASACSKRTIPLAFTRTFDSSDTSLTSFEEQTFTRDTLGRIVAQAMALATFYQEHPSTFGYSTTTTSQKRSIQAENDSVSLFRASFVKYFGGFQNWSLLYEDYCHWCQHKEYRYQQRSALQLCFNDCKHESCRVSRTYLTASGKTCKKFRRLPKPRPRTRPLMPDLYLPELKRDVASLHRSGLSAVYELEECYGTNT